MPGKIPSPWYRESKGAWYVCLDGSQINLGRDKDEAFRRFHQLMLDRGTQAPGIDPSLTVGRLAEVYTNDCRHRLKPNPFKMADYFLRSFVALYGSHRAITIKARDLDAWVRQHPNWGPSTENAAKTRIVAMFRWGVDQDMLARNPIRRLHRPPIRSRGRQTLIDPTDHKRLMESASAALRNVLIALHDTGARPSEVASVTAADFNPDRGIWVLDRHKTDQDGQPRVIYLTPGLVDLCRDLAVKYPEGPLFRNQKGQPWRPGIMASLIWKLRHRLGLSGKVMAYGYRHTFCTDALVRGVPEALVTELVGHKGTAMLHRHYSHLSARSDALRKALGQVREPGQDGQKLPDSQSGHTPGQPGSPEGS
jgi:integrase